jgi:hypothetical protein
MTRQKILAQLEPIQVIHLKKAMAYIDKNGVPFGRGSQKFDVLNHETGLKYPPPYLLEIAFKESTGKDLPSGFFSGIKKGGPHFEKIENLGYSVQQKSNSGQRIIKDYKDSIVETHMKDEAYKWELLAEYRGRPNTDAADFSEEIHAIKFKNLMYPMASAVIRQIAKVRPEEIRLCFKDLYNEALPLEERMKDFNLKTLEIYRSIWETLGHHQDERTIATYLTFFNPEKYTFYKRGIYKPLCELMGAKEAGKFKNYSHYLSLLNRFIEQYIVTDLELMDLVKSYIPRLYNGTNHLLLAQDILFHYAEKQRQPKNSDERATKYWIFSPGKNAVKWEEFCTEKIMAINGDRLGNLNNFQSQEQIAAQLRQIERTESSKKNDAKAYFEFVYSLKEGDIVFVKQGNSKLLGYGEVTGPSKFDEKRPEYKNYRNVDWKLTGEWDTGHPLVQKALTDITDYSAELEGYEHYYDQLFACMGISLDESCSGTKQLIGEFIGEASTNNLYFQPYLIKRYIASLATKPFVIFTGLSGSGKTKLAQTFAKWICESEAQYKIIPVGADWTNPEPILGYPNSLEPNTYVLPDNGALDLILAAIENAEGKEEKDCKPYFLILDEMNLSHVERYFADFLSGMESKESISLYTGNDRNDENGRPIPKKIKLPSNLFMIGTVNIDETTYMFSPKVLDRANTIEFRVDKNDLAAFFDAPNEEPTSAIDGKGTVYSKEFMEFVASETDGKTNYQEQLLGFFKALQPIGAEFGYRTANEMNRLMAQLELLGLEKNEHALDVAVMQKLLPKLHGSRTKLNKVMPILASFCFKACSSEQAKTLLEEIKREGQLVSDNKQTLPLSFAKIARMYAAAQENGFASYAEG